MSLRQQILHNFWLKLFSFVLAALIWFVVSIYLRNVRNVGNDLASDVEEVSVTNVMVAVLASAEDPRRFAIQPPAVEVVLKGKAADLRTVSPDEVRVCVDLRGLRSPQGGEPVIVSLAAPRQVMALRAIPSVVTVKEFKN